jgi:hypothetical protein
MALFSGMRKSSQFLPHCFLIASDSHAVAGVLSGYLFTQVSTPIYSLVANICLSDNRSLITRHSRTQQWSNYEPKLTQGILPRWLSMMPVIYRLYILSPFSNNKVCHCFQEYPNPSPCNSLYYDVGILRNSFATFSGVFRNLPSSLFQYGLHTLHKST